MLFWIKIYGKNKIREEYGKKNLEFILFMVVINDLLINWGGKCWLLYIDIYLFIISNKVIFIFKFNL